MLIVSLRQEQKEDASEKLDIVFCVSRVYKIGIFGCLSAVVSTKVLLFLNYFENAKQAALLKSLE